MPPRADERAAAAALLEHGSEIVLAAEMRRRVGGLARRTSEDRRAMCRLADDGRLTQRHQRDAAESSQQLTTTRKLGGRRVSTSAGDLINRTSSQVTEDPQSRLNGGGRVELSSTVTSERAVTGCSPCGHHASLNAEVDVNTTSADVRQG